MLISQPSSIYVIENKTAPVDMAREELLHYTTAAQSLRESVAVQLLAGKNSPHRDRIRRPTSLPASKIAQTSLPPPNTSHRHPGCQQAIFKMAAQTASEAMKKLSGVSPSSRLRRGRLPRETRTIPGRAVKCNFR